MISHTNHLKALVTWESILIITILFSVASNVMTNSLYDRMMSSVYGSLDSDLRTDLLSPSGTDVDNPFPGIVSPNSISNFDLLKPYHVEATKCFTGRSFWFIHTARY